MVENNELSSGHAKILVGLENALFVANKNYRKKLSVRQSEKFVNIFKKRRVLLLRTKMPIFQILKIQLWKKLV